MKFLAPSSQLDKLSDLSNDELLGLVMVMDKKRRGDASHICTECLIRLMRHLESDKND
jgi:hypothetical protein